MKRFAALFLLIFLCPALGSYLPKTDVKPLVEAFNQSTIEFSQFNINGWARLKKVYYKEDEMLSLAGSIFDSMGIKITHTDQEYDGLNKKITVKGEYEEGILAIIVENIYDNMGKNYETFIFMEITQSESMKNIISMGDKLSYYLNEFGLKPDVKVNIAGYVNGYMEKPLRESLVYGFFKDIDAKIIESVNNDNLLSVSGYTKNITQYVKSNNKMININIACRYSKSDDKTFFWVATPVINMDY